MKSQELTSENSANERLTTSDAIDDTTKAGSAVSSVEVGLNAARTVYWWIVALLLLSYGLSGVTQIAPDEVGVVRRLGRWVKANDEVVIHRPGLLFALPVPFDRVEKIPVKQERSVDIRLIQDSPSEMLDDAEEENQLVPAESTVADTATSASASDQTDDAPIAETASPVQTQYLLAGDRGLLGVSLQVRYRIADPVAWLTASCNADELIRRVVLGATSSVIGRWTSDEVLRRQKSSGSDDSMSLQSAVLDVAGSQVRSMNLGLELTAIEFTSIQPPSEVRDAFVAIQDARVDQESWRDEANGEDAEIRLNAERMALVAIADATSMLDSIPGKVAAEIELFEADRAAYEAGQGQLVAERIRRETWEAILKSAGRVIALPSGERSEGLWLSVPDAEAKK